MFRLVKTDGTEIGITDTPRFIKRDATTGVFVTADESEAVGIAFKGKPYNLFGHDEIQDAPVVLLVKFNIGDIVREQRDVSSIMFVAMAERGDLDEVTAAEHTDTFENWVPGTAYSVGQIRKSGKSLYRCIQAHTSQADWAPEKTPALWKKIGDPAEEWPEWSRPLGAHDAYEKGAKVTYNGEHWTSTVDANVWTPGEYGWQKEEAAA